jgi:hypothetical protein
MSDSTDQILLTEIRALRTDFNDFAREFGERVAKNETQIYSLIGNGQPGRMSRAESAIESLKQWRWKIVGIATGASSVVTVVAWLIERN